LTYNTLSNEYLVAYFFESGASSNVGSQRVQPGTGALIGGRSTIYGSVFEQYPEIAYNSQANQYLAITWGFSGASWMLHGGLADGTAEPLPGAPLSLAAGGGGDGIGLAYHPLKNSYLGVFLSTTNDEIWGVEVGSNGVPGAPFQVTVSGTRLATQPRPAADPTRQRWLAVASDAFTRVMGQFVGTGAAPTGVPVDGTPPPTSSPTPGACTTIQPAPDWVCVNGNWLPPSEPAPAPAPAPAPTPPPPGTCTTIQPAPDWVCVNGNWLPPGFGTPAPSPTPTPTPTPAPTPPPPGTCTTASPVPGWVCIGDNNWVPPDHPLANPTTPSPTPTPTPLPTGCTATIASPVPGWVCVGDAWVPPDHPLALALAGSGG
jgi:hypothetical protein